MHGFHEIASYHRSSRDFDGMFLCSSAYAAGVGGGMHRSDWACMFQRCESSWTKVLHSEVIATKKAEVRDRRKANADIKSANSDVVPKTDASSSAQPGNNITTSAITAKPETRQASQFDDQSDPVITKAKATIAAKMANPASVEFVEIKRAVGTNTISNSGDIVCGFVKEKNGEPRPFLYLVPKDEVYIGGYNIATSAYRHICSITL